MLDTTACVGELELVSTARFLQKTIIVVDEQFQKISVYKPGDAVSHGHRKTDTDTFTLQFQKLRHSIGHCSAVLADREHVQQATTSNTSSKQSRQLVTANDIFHYQRNRP